MDYGTKLNMDNPHRKIVASGHFVLREAKEFFHWPKCEWVIFFGTYQFCEKCVENMEQIPGLNIEKEI
jgi:hypothetical protein